MPLGSFSSSFNINLDEIPEFQSASFNGPEFSLAFDGGSFDLSSNTESKLVEISNSLTIYTDAAYTNELPNAIKRIENISQDSIKLTLDTLVLQDSSIVNRDTLFIKYNGGSNLLRSATGHDVGQFFGSFDVYRVYVGVNNAPQRLAGSLADLFLGEDAAPISLGFENLEYSPGDGEDHQTLNYLVETIPDADFGVIMLSDGTVVQEGNSYTIEQMRGMTFVASENANGNSEFSFIVEDSGVLQAPTGGSERSALNVYIDDQEILEQEASQRIDLNQDGIYSVQLSLSLADITSTTTNELINVLYIPIKKVILFLLLNLLIIVKAPSL